MKNYKDKNLNLMTEAYTGMVKENIAATNPNGYGPQNEPQAPVITADDMDLAISNDEDEIRREIGNIDGVTIVNLNMVGPNNYPVIAVSGDMDAMQRFYDWYFAQSPDVSFDEFLDIYTDYDPQPEFDFDKDVDHGTGYDPSMMDPTANI